MKRIHRKSIGRGGFLILSVALLPGQQCLPPPESALTDLEAGWQNVYMGSETDIPFFPDGNAVYMDYRFLTSPDAPIGIRIHGAFPAARYMGITVYDNAGFTVNNRIQDTEIVPDEGLVNPFAENMGSTGQDTYTVDILPEGFDTAPEHNVVHFDAGLTDVSIFMRYYLPEGDASGGVPFPRLTAFDVQTGEVRALPVFQPPPGASDNPIADFVRTTLRDYFVQNQINLLFSLGERKILRAYRFSGQGLYSNGDTSYLVMLIRKQRDEVALIRFKPPSYAERPEMNGSADVRYWSISQGDDRSYNVATLADRPAKLHQDGFVYLALAEAGPDLTAAVGTDNFMPWLVGERGVLIFRHLVTHPDFEHAFGSVPEFDPDAPPEPQAAVNHIGEYAPIGILVNRVQFVRDGFKPIRAAVNPAAP